MLTERFRVQVKEIASEPAYTFLAEIARRPQAARQPIAADNGEEGVTYQLAAFRLRPSANVPPDSPISRSTSPPRTTAPPTSGLGRVAAQRRRQVELLSLIYALLLPQANDFMGQDRQRSLTDYVDSGRHLTLSRHGILGRQPDTYWATTGRILVTGVVHEWSDLRRPATPTEPKDKLDSDLLRLLRRARRIRTGRVPVLDASGERAPGG